MNSTLPNSIRTLLFLNVGIFLIDYLTHGAYLFQWLALDPMLVAAGIQVIRAIGIKRLIPILAVGGLALGFLASRNTQADEVDAPAE